MPKVAFCMSKHYLSHCHSLRTAHRKVTNGSVFIILLSQTKPIILTISIITKYRILVFFPHPLFFSSYKRFSEGKKGVSFLILPIERLTQESAPICKNRHEKKLLHTDKSHAGSCRQMRIKFNCKSMDNSTEKHHIFIFLMLLASFPTK